MRILTYFIFGLNVQYNCGCIRWGRHLVNMIERFMLDDDSDCFASITVATCIIECVTKTSLEVAPTT